MMRPLITSIKTRKAYQIGSHHVELWAGIESAGSVKYKYVMALFDQETQRPVFFVSSEVDSTDKAFGGSGNSHFLCIFDDAHRNLGASDEWGDEGKFVEAALHIIRKKLQIVASDGTVSNPRVCSSCGFDGVVKGIFKGSPRTELLLWILPLGIAAFTSVAALFLLVLPLCYTFLRASSEFSRCPQCHAETKKY